MYDVCIIGGGGVVGSAIARELAQRELAVVCLERHPAACRETSGLNSRVIHSGFHEASGTLVYPAVPPHSPSKGIHFGPRTDGRLYLGPSATTTSNPAPKQLFLDAARKFLPDVGDNDIEWAYAGVRPKQVSGTSRSDFIIRLDRAVPPLVNLIGIDSPGLSASMAIAEYLAGQIAASKL